MKKFIYIFLLLIIFQTTSYAYKLEEVGKPNSSYSQYNILAEDTDNIFYGVQVRLDITNGEFINYTQGNLLSIGACGDNLFYESNKICVDIVKEFPVEKNENLGSFEVNWNINSGIRSIDIGDGAAYFDENIKKELDKKPLYQINIEKDSNIELFILTMLLIVVVLYMRDMYVKRNIPKLVSLMLVLLIPTGIYIEKLYTITLSDVVLLPATGVSTTIFNKKVLVVIYNPTMTNGKKLNIDRGWADPVTLSNNLKTWFSNTSSGRVNYQLTFQQINDFTTLEGNQKYTPATYLSCLSNRANCKHTGVDNWLDFDYNKFFTDNQICTKANAGTIDEVWVWGGPYFGYWESTILGPQSKLFPFYHGGFANSSCTKLVPIMGLNYERDYDMAIESFGHRVEATMDKVYGNYNASNPSTNWDKFVYKLHGGNPSLMNGAYGCGNIHYTANSTVEYKKDTLSYVKSYCDTFFNYPSISSSISNQINVNGNTWGGNHLGHFTYWFKHIPNKSGCGLDKKTNDWWEFIIDPNNVYLSENTNCTPSATSTITPSPNVSVLVTVTNAPTITSTIDPSVTITNIPTLAISPTNLDSTPKITPTIDLSPVDCGALDVNDDDKLNLFDFINFSKVYNKQCKDNYPSTGCGAKDSNADGMINIMDFVYFAKHYHTRSISCSVE